MVTMLKTRIIPVMLWKKGGLVKGRGFDHSRNVGTVLPSVRVYNLRDVDELCLLNVDATLNGSGPRVPEIAEIAKICSVPLSVGGGISSEMQIEQVLGAGADKVVLNSSCYDDPEFVARASRLFGTQCVIVGIDYRTINGEPICFSHAGTVKREQLVSEWAKQLEHHGAGELLLTDCSRDGFMSGFDLETISDVSQRVGIPVIAAGGAGVRQHFLDAVKAGADAVAAGSVFHFTEITPREIKVFLSESGVPVRLGSRQ
jgi:cyclase